MDLSPPILFIDPSHAPPARCAVGFWSGLGVCFLHLLLVLATSALLTIPAGSKPEHFILAGVLSYGIWLFLTRPSRAPAREPARLRFPIPRLRVLAVGRGDASICPVCAEAVDRSDCADCALCGAPHHPECWCYVGGCAVYACGGDVAELHESAPDPHPPEPAAQCTRA